MNVSEKIVGEKICSYSSVHMLQVIDYGLMIMVVHLQSFHGDTNQFELKDYMKNYLLRYKFINKAVINYLVDLIGEKALYHTSHSSLFIFTLHANT